MTPIYFFKYLKGSWVIDRRISNYGYLKGTAKLHLTNRNSLMYREDLVMESSRKEWHRDYIYSYEENRLRKHFSDGRLFYTLQFNCVEESIITGEHFCGCDIYKAIYNIKDENAFSLKYKVLGPNKSYDIVTEFIRVDRTLA